MVVPPIIIALTTQITVEGLSILTVWISTYEYPFMSISNKGISDCYLIYTKHVIQFDIKGISNMQHLLLFTYVCLQVNVQTIDDDHSDRPCQ